ncbi:MAG: DUF512 domain-containing protein [Bacillota bacterium]
MDYSAEQLLVLSAQERNILPITSHCNLNCLFCSHQSNPEAVEVFSEGHYSLEKIKKLSAFLTSQQKIVIGESITRIVEGEPFIHPDFKEILTYLRHQFSQTKIQITTNGSQLTTENVRFLANLGLIELNVSLNSAQPKLRQKLMADRNSNQALQGVINLARFQIPYHGSIVAMPQIGNWDYIEDTVDFFNQQEAQTVRIFLPGYTKLTSQQLQVAPDLWQQLTNYVEYLNNKYRVPLLVEPPRIDDLNVVIKGVINNSPADKIGLQKKDRILKINGTEVRTRVEAFNRLVGLEDPELIYSHAGKIKQQRLDKPADEKSGVVLDYDISWQRLLSIQEEIKVRQARRVVLLTSQLAADIIRAGMNKIKCGLDSDIEIEIIPVSSQFFAGNIKAAGLLVVDDFLATIEQHQQQLEAADLVFVPQEPFNRWGYDLVGTSDEVLENKLSTPLIIS